MKWDFKQVMARARRDFLNDADESHELEDAIVETLENDLDYEDLIDVYKSLGGEYPPEDDISLLEICPESLAHQVYEKYINE